MAVHWGMGIKGCGAAVDKIGSFKRALAFSSL